MALAWTLLTLCSVTKRQTRDTLMTFLSEGMGVVPNISYLCGAEWQSICLIL